MCPLTEIQARADRAAIMAAQVEQERWRTQKAAARKLALLIELKLGHDVDPDKLSDMIVQDWEKIISLAHIIHRGWR